MGHHLLPTGGVIVWTTLESVGSVMFANGAECLSPFSLSSQEFLLIGIERTSGTRGTPDLGIEVAGRVKEKVEGRVKGMKLGLQIHL